MLANITALATLLAALAAVSRLELRAQHRGVTIPAELDTAELADCLLDTHTQD